MTMQEVEYRTPNGLHDAYLLGLSIDYEERILRLKISWVVSLPQDSAAKSGLTYRKGELVVSGLKYCVVGPPVKGDGEAPDQINGFVTGEEEIERCNLPEVDSGIFRHSIYLGYWTSFIHFAGASAEVFPGDLIVREMGA
jgi:hypothetical protein